MQITGISNFADQVEEGHLFVCESGAFYDGHEHISAAIERGAVLIVARLQLPGAELAMCIDSEDEDFDPRSPQFEGLYSGDSIYGLADNDAKTVAKAQESIENSYEHLEEFAAANGIDARTKEHMQTVGAARIASAALEYDITHWDDPKSAPPSATALAHALLRPAAANVCCALQRASARTTTYRRRTRSITWSMWSSTSLCSLPSTRATFALCW